MKTKSAPVSLLFAWSAILLVCALDASAAVQNIFYKLDTGNTLNPTPVSIAAPGNYSHSAAAPVSGTYWNRVSRNTLINLTGVAAGTTLTYSANNQAAGGAVVDSANNSLSGVSLTITLFNNQTGSTRTEPATGTAGENTIQPGGITGGVPWRDFYGGNYYTYTFAGLPASTPFDLYVYGFSGTVSTSVGGANITVPAAYAVSGSDTTVNTTPAATANSAGAYGAIWTGTSPNYTLMAQNTWMLIHGKTDASGSFVFKHNGGGNGAYLGGFQLVRVPISTYSMTGGGSDCSSVSVGLSGSETGIKYQLYNGSTAIGSPVSGTGNALSWSATSSGTYTVKGWVSDGTTTGLTNTMTGSASVTINAPTTVSGASPAGQGVGVGTTVNIAVTTGGTAPTTYVWKKDGVTLGDGASGNGSTYSGATTATLTINNAQLGDSATTGHGYTCTVSGGCGSPTSAEAVLTITSSDVAPSIDGLTNQTVLAGNNVTLAATISGSPTPSLQWYLSTDGGSTSNAVSGATSASLVLTSVQHSQSGNIYYLRAVNTAGVAVSNMTLTVNHTLPTVTGPASQTAFAGNNATFSATVGGAPAPTLQWLVNGVPIANATNSSLTVSNVYGSQNGWIYSLQAANSAGTVTSNATLTVTSRQLCLNLETATGASYDNGTAVAPDSGTRWNHLGTGAIVNAIDSLGNATTCGIAITGAGNGWNNPSASLGNPNPVGLMGDYLFNGPYTVTVTNLPQGNYTLYAFAHGDVANQNSTVTVNAANGGASGNTATTGNYRDIFDANAAGNSYLALGATVGSSGTFTFTSSGYLNGFQLKLVAPAGVSGLTNQTVVAGQSATLVPVVIGTTPISYQWNSNGVAIAGATSSTLTLNNVQYSQNGTVYSVVVGNAAGTDTNSMTLTVIVTPSITGLADQAASPGNTVTLAAIVSGVPAPSLQWLRGGSPVADGATGNGSTVSGSTSATLTITSAAVADSAYYSLVASNAAGIMTNTIYLTVASQQAPVITGPVNQTVIQGSNATFTVSVSANPVADLQWLDQTGAPISGATSSTLTLINVTYSQNGYTYSLVASNSVGVATNSATLTVLVPVSIFGQPQNTVVTNTQSASFTMTAGGVPSPSYYQWYFNGGAISGANSATYTIGSAAPANMGSYQVVVSNSVNAATSSVVTLTVNSTMGYTSLTPADGTTGISYDTPLYIQFDATPTLRNAGKIRIYDASSPATPVDTIDLSLNVTNDATYSANVQTYTIGGASYSAFPVIITGNQAAIYPHRGVLSSNKTYYVTVDNGTFKDSAGAYFAGITANNAWRFTTKPTGPANSTSLVVAQDYSGDFATVQGAVDSIAGGNTTPRLISIKNGTYVEIVNVNAKHNLQFRGESRSGTIIGYANNNTLNGGAPGRAAFNMAGNDCIVESLTITNMTPKGGSQAEALDWESNRGIMYNINLCSYQDTFLCHYAGNSILIQDSLVQGDTDFMWGYAAVYVTNCELRGLSSGSHVTQPRNPVGQRGFGFVNCRVTKGYATAGTFDLGRTFGSANAEALFVRCLMDDAVTGFNDASSTNTADYICSNLTATASKSLANSMHLTASDAAVLAAQSATSWFNGVTPTWSPAVSPNVLSAPTNQVVTVGQSATFTVSASGIPAPAYQWTKNGTNVPGATSATLTINNATHSDAGTYSVVVSNAAGTAVSSATLTYNNASPVANTLAVNRNAGTDVLIPLSNIASNWSDLDSDSLKLASINWTTTNGVALIPVSLVTNLDGSYVVSNTAYLGYVGGANVDDGFSYTVSDGFGGTTTGYVRIVVSGGPVYGNGNRPVLVNSNGVVSVTLYGIPGITYVVQRNLTVDEGGWIDLSTNTPSTLNPAITITDTNNVQAFYRLKYSPN